MNFKDILNETIKEFQVGGEVKKIESESTIPLQRFLQNKLKETFEKFKINPNDVFQSQQIDQIGDTLDPKSYFRVTLNLNPKFAGKSFGPNGNEILIPNSITKFFKLTKNGFSTIDTEINDIPEKPTKKEFTIDATKLFNTWASIFLRKANLSNSTQQSNVVDLNKNKTNYIGGIK
jgi:hypothetical protein